MFYNENFLNNLQTQQHRVVFGRISLLDKEERTIDRIEGRVQSGSINVDGTSAVRRTCSFSLISQEVNVSNYLWSLESKFKLEIGLENHLDQRYPEIIWFPQGVFIVTSFSSSLSVNSYTININGKDKMCLLNGEVGGIFNSQIDFGQLEQKDKNGNIRLIKMPIKKIIREMIHQYGGEPFSNIIINDLDDTGLELLEYRLREPLYIWRNAKNGKNTFENGTLDMNRKVKIYDTRSDKETIGQIKKISEIEQFDPLKDDPEVFPTQVYLLNSQGQQENNEIYCVAQINFGDAAGYRETELVYPGDLIAKAGETITSILDKIKNMLTFYEYFYNLEGQFIFQKKRDYRQITYSLEGSNLLTAFNNTPDLKNARNDFTVWGTRRTIDGADVPIHMRKAIQKKPVKYTSITVTDEELKKYNEAYGLNTKGQQSKTYSIEDYDWRELIYQMSLDYRKYNHLDDFELKIIYANAPDNLYQSGTTGYEQYYIDMEGFWRQLYNPNPDKKHKDDFYNDPSNKDTYHWNKNVLEHPESLNFSFDFIDTDGILSNYSNDAIGNRPKVNNNSMVKAISYREIPFIIFGDPGDNPKTGYRYFNAKNFENAFSISAQGKSAEYEINYMLSEYSYCLESVSITAIPIYNLNPNVLIHLNDLRTGINGDYAITKYSLPLAYNGTMSLTASKRIYSIY